MQLTTIQRRNVPLFRLCFALLSLLLLYSPIPAVAVDQNTAFLPLRINAPDPASLQTKADTALTKVLADRGFTMLSRQDLSGVAAGDAWPPPVAVLNRIVEQTGFDFVVAGSLTRLGDAVSVDLSVFDALAPAKPFTAFRQAPSLEQLETILDEVVSEALSFSNRDVVVGSIAPEGNNRIDSGAILRKITTKPGDFYDPAKLRQDLREVFSMGYFDNVEIDVSDTETGKAVVFRVQEKPLIGSVIIDGTDELKLEDVSEAANIQVNTILNPAKINEAVQRIKELYRSKGYYNTEVVADITYPTEKSAEVRLKIDEGGEVTIREIRFSGNNSFDSDELEDVIQTGTYSWWISWLTDAGVLKEDVLSQDASRIAAFYQNHGFMEAKVGEAVIEQKEDDLYVTFPIEEGPRYRVGTVDIQGTLIKDREELIDMLAIRKEPFLNRQVLRDDTLRITDLYAENGYAFAEVSPRVTKAETGKRVDITLHVDQGSLVYFNRIEIRGNTRTRDNVIRRDLDVREGGVFDSKAIRSSTQKLQRLNYFEEVKVNPEPTLQEDQMNVVVDVKEKATGQFSIGAGYSSTENLMFMGEISEENVLGTGNRLSLAANLSSKTTRYNLNFTNPRLFDTQVSTGFDLYNWEREYDDYTKDSTGGGLRFGHPLIEKWRIYYGYSLEDTNLTDIAENASQIIVQSEDIHWTSKLNLSLVRDTRDRYFAPEEGSRHKLTGYYAGGFLGGDAEFTKVEGSTEWYFPVILQTTLQLKLAAGQAFENEDDKLPVYEHFYLGGMNTIRGFDTYSISPIDPATGDKIGGDKMWYGTVALIFPLLKDAGLKGEVFTDFGNVYGTDEDWDLSDYKKTAGLGVLWLSPLGPLRLAWGFNLDQQEGEDSNNWDFSMGGTF